MHGTFARHICTAHLHGTCAREAMRARLPVANHLPPLQGHFDAELYASVNSDESLLQEIVGMPKPE